MLVPNLSYMWDHVKLFVIFVGSSVFICVFMIIQHKSYQMMNTYISQSYDVIQKPTQKQIINQHALYYLTQIKFVFTCSLFGIVFSLLLFVLFDDVV